MSTARRLELLRLRADLLRRLRRFFDERGFLEVETPLVDDEIIPELHIEPLGVVEPSQLKVPSTSSREATPRRGAAEPPGRSTLSPAAPAERNSAANRTSSVAAGEGTGVASKTNDATPRCHWLQASPELHMKRLLAEGLPAIYQATRSFRAGERGPLHNPEFAIVEWYRAGDDYQAGMALLGDLVSTLVGLATTIRRTTYRDAFLRHAGVDPFAATCELLVAAAHQAEVSVPDDMPAGDRDEWLNLLLATTVEPQLGAEGPEILCDYPASQAALALTARREDGREVAERFELYWRGVELANGYAELTDAAALRARLGEVNRRRRTAGRVELPAPERLLAAMASPGLPPCSGCALGFDRLVMLLAKVDSIEMVRAFSASSP